MTNEHIEPIDKQKQNQPEGKMMDFSKLLEQMVAMQNADIKPIQPEGLPNITIHIRKGDGGTKLSYAIPDGIPVLSQEFKKVLESWIPAATATAIASITRGVAQSKDAAEIKLTPEQSKQVLELAVDRLGKRLMEQVGHEICSYMREGVDTYASMNKAIDTFGEIAKVVEGVMEAKE